MTRRLADDHGTLIVALDRKEIRGVPCRTCLAAGKDPGGRPCVVCHGHGHLWAIPVPDNSPEPEEGDDDMAKQQQQPSDPQSQPKTFNPSGFIQLFNDLYAKRAEVADLAQTVVADVLNILNGKATTHTAKAAHAVGCDGGDCCEACDCTVCCATQTLAAAIKAKCAADKCAGGGGTP